jgi:outer membrane lipopolysaccharide assembly protein LptE/RlpB
LNRFSIYIILIAAGLCITLPGCGFYSHTGASVPPDAKTFSVTYIPNLASIVAPTLSQQLTERLKQKFINETQLKLAQIDGDLQVSGKIIDYQTAPIGVQGNGVNASNQLSLKVEITFENTKDESKNFTQVFPTIVNYPADQNFAAVEQQLIQTAVEQVVTDIFNKIFINW